MGSHQLSWRLSMAESITQARTGTLEILTALQEARTRTLDLVQISTKSS